VPLIRLLIKKKTCVVARTLSICTLHLPPRSPDCGLIATGGPNGNPTLDIDQKTSFHRRRSGDAEVYWFSQALDKFLFQLSLLQNSGDRHILDSLLRVKHFGRGRLDFQGMLGLSLRCLFWPDEGFPSGLWFIVRMSPPSYPSAWLLPSRARLRFTWFGDCNAYAITIWGNSLLPS
jgi:hypothetical protein